MRSGYFFGAILLHLVVFLMVATLIIWRAPSPPSDNTEFRSVTIKTPPPPLQPPASGASPDNPQFEPEQVTVPVVTPPSMITTTRNSAFSVDSSKIINQALDHASVHLPAGSGMGVDGSSSGSGPGSSFFGAIAQSSTPGFEGTFYDFTRTQGGKVNAMTPAIYADIIRSFCKTWQAPADFPCYKSNVTLFSQFFFFPPIADNLAGKAFKTPLSTEAFWIAHYHGSFTSDSVGEYRFVGFGDNLLAVRVNDRIVLDASDHGYIKGNGPQSGVARKLVGATVLPGKGGGTPLYLGDSFLVEQGQSVHVDIAIGDEGGIFCAGLFLAPKDTALTFTDAGIPKLPLFTLGVMNDDDKMKLAKYLPPECLVNPINLSVVTETVTSY